MATEAAHVRGAKALIELCLRLGEVAPLELTTEVVAEALRLDGLLSTDAANVSGRGEARAKARGTQAILGAARRTYDRKRQESIAANHVAVDAKHEQRRRYEAYQRALRAQNEHAKQLAQASDAITALTDERETIEIGDPGALEDMREALGAERIEVRQRLDALTDYDAAQTAQMSQEQRHSEAKARRTQLRAAREHLRAVLGRLLHNQLSPLVAPMSRITERVIDATVEVDLTDGAHFYLVRDGERIRLDDAPASARVVTYAALQAVIRSSLGGWRHLILDDLETLDHERRTRFIEALRIEVDEKRLDQVLVACVDDGWEPPEGTHTIRLDSNDPTLTAHPALASQGA